MGISGEEEFDVGLIQGQGVDHFHAIWETSEVKLAPIFFFRKCGRLTGPFEFL